MVGATSNWRGSFDSDCKRLQGQWHVDKMKNNTFLNNVITCVNNLGSFITVAVKLGFSAANKPLKPNHMKNVKRYCANACLGDNRHGSFWHRKEVLNPMLVVARKVLHRRSEILLMIIWQLKTSILAWRNIGRRMKKERYFQCHIIFKPPLCNFRRKTKPSAISFSNLDSTILI